MRICELHDKEVVNVKDGCILGCVVDIDFEEMLDDQEEKTKDIG